MRWNHYSSGNCPNDLADVKVWSWRVRRIVGVEEKSRWRWMQCRLLFQISCKTWIFVFFLLPAWTSSLFSTFKPYSLTSKSSTESRGNVYWEYESKRNKPYSWFKFSQRKAVRIKLQIIVRHTTIRAFSTYHSDSANSKRNVWTLVIHRSSTHSKISKTAMFNQRPMGSPILNIFKSNLLQWFYN